MQFPQSACQTQVWNYAVVVRFMLGLTDIIYMPATNRIMASEQPTLRMGSALGVFQTMSGTGMALFPLLTPILSSGHITLYWKSYC